jgi:hypothetical protein
MAKWGDACNLGSADLDQFRRKLAILKKHCADVGRDYNEIVRSTGVTVHLIESEQTAEQETAKARGNKSYAEYAQETIVGTPAMVVERLQRLVDAGWITSSSRSRASHTTRTGCGIPLRVGGHPRSAWRLSHERCRIRRTSTCQWSRVPRARWRF